MEHELPGPIAGRYFIEARLGGGAMGTVYRARDAKRGRAVAIKLLRRELAQDDALVMRFEHEARFASRLRHPNLVQVLDVGCDDGTWYTVMELATGVCLSKIIGTPLARTQIIVLLRPILDALQHAHECGVIHRDLKPDNIVVEQRAVGLVPRLIDFGIAIGREQASTYESRDRFTTKGVILGTPEYMAPEQAQSLPLDHRADLFALGVITYQLCTGKLPFDGTRMEVAVANMSQDAPPMATRSSGVAVDPLLEAFTRKLMHRDRNQRPASAAAALDLLDMIDTEPHRAAAVLGLVDGDTTIPMEIVPQTTTPIEIIPPAAVSQTTTPLPIISKTPLPQTTPLPVLPQSAPTTVPVPLVRKKPAFDL